MAKEMQKWEDFWGNMDEARKKMNEVLHGMVPFQAGRIAKEWGLGEWYPAVDVMETRTEVVVTAELPGMSEKDIDIDLAEDSLTLKGERHEATEIKKEGWIKKERSFGKFYRKILLPARVNTEKNEAVFKNGVLIIHLTKIKPEGKGKKINIKKEE